MLTLHASDSSAVALFQRTHAQLATLLPEAISIEHVGSTAVPGLAGKGIVDIVIGLADEQRLNDAAAILTRHGYYAARDAAKRTDRVFMASRQEETGPGDIHLHLVLQPSTTYDGFIALRDYLCEHPQIAADYYEAKQRFAKQSAYDRETYKTLKGEYVSELLKKALEWRKRPSNGH
ncbi:GrpB family protein [Candidatus Saccharibacteria bacterium]|nr:MAG: GrpB family protein [Candidatus Saccharibacteria bacterium]